MYTCSAHQWEEEGISRRFPYIVIMELIATLSLYEQVVRGEGGDKEEVPLYLFIIRLRGKGGWRVTMRDKEEVPLYLFMIRLGGERGRRSRDKEEVSLYLSISRSGGEGGRRGDEKG